MDERELHQLAVRACEGNPVHFCGLNVYALHVPGILDPCQICEMDSLCTDELSELCEACTLYTGGTYILSFKPKLGI